MTNHKNINDVHWDEQNVDVLQRKNVKKVIAILGLHIFLDTQMLAYIKY